MEWYGKYAIIFNTILFFFFPFLSHMTVVLLPFPFSFFLVSLCTLLSSQTTLVTLLPLLGISPFFCPSIFDGGGCDSWGFRWWWQIVMVLAVVAVDCGGWVRKSSIFFCFELSLSSFFSQTPQVNSFFALIKPKFLYFGLIFGGGRLGFAGLIFYWFVFDMFGNLVWY